MDKFRFKGYTLDLGTNDDYSQSKLIRIMMSNGWDWLGSY